MSAFCVDIGLLIVTIISIIFFFYYKNYSELSDKFLQMHASLGENKYSWIFHSSNCMIFLPSQYLQNQQYNSQYLQNQQ